jgi:hypothetical protein
MLLCSVTFFEGENNIRILLCKIYPIQLLLKIRNRVVVIATGYGLNAKVSEFESRYKQDFYPLHVVQTDSGVHRASYPNCAGYRIVGVKAVRG